MFVFTAFEPDFGTTRLHSWMMPIVIKMMGGAARVPMSRNRAHFVVLRSNGVFTAEVMQHKGP